MGEYKIISRSALYQSEDEHSSSEDEQIYAPKLEFVEVNVDSVDSHEYPDPNANEDEEPQEDEFAFPLFAGGGTSQDEVMKVSLKEEEEEIIINERPETYYRASYSDDKRKEFELAAVSFEDILMEVSAVAIDAHPWKVMDLLQHNEKIDLEQKRKKHKREGKRKRTNKSICRERRKEREKEIKRLEREEKKQRYRPQGQGWKVNKVRNKVVPTKTEKPKYRTE